MFGELVCGPPGSGKTTYCEGKRQFLSVYDPTRPVVLLNLDPANEDVFPYPCDVDIRELVSHARVMMDEGLGPNGSYMFCASVIEANMEWVIHSIEVAVERRLVDVATATGSSTTTTTTAITSSSYSTRAPYLIVDCPGQVEFYVGSTVMHELFKVLQKRLCCSLCTVHLVDAGVSTRDISTYVSSCLLSITTMIDHELPHVNVMSKWDTLSPEEVEEGESYLRASCFMAEDFDRLWKKQLRKRRREHRRAKLYTTGNESSPRLDPKNEAKYDEEVEAIDLNKDGGHLYHYSKSVMDVIDGYGLVGFQPLDVQSQDMMLRLTQQIDEAVGDMETLLEILRTSTDNDERKKASAQLRHIQENSPETFLTYTWEVISSSTVSTAVRFFMASTVVEFVEQSWHNAVPQVIQFNMIDRYAQLLLTEIFPSLALSRKVAVVLSLMVMRCGVKAAPGALPAPMERTAKLLADAALQYASNMNMDTVNFMTQCLLVLHVFLKEAQKKRIGGVFPKVCTLLVPVMSNLFSASTWWDHVEHYLPFLYLLKCALRVFGFGVFEVSFYPYLLDTTWKLARALSTMDSQQQQQQQQYLQRLLEYAIKVQAKMVSVFPSRLKELSLAFFIPVDANNGQNDSLFGLIDAILSSPVGVVTTEKMLCRSMRLITTILSAEDSDAFITTCLTEFANTPLLAHMIECVIMLLADDTSASSLRAWDVQPEVYAAELEVDVDDDNSITASAEELLLGLTGSTNCAAISLSAAWRVINTLLETGDVGQVTAALHAIGICYYTMSVGQDPGNYLAFLTGKLLPLIESAANNNTNNNSNSGSGESQPSPFVLRRVVWIVGMWCESVSDVNMRRRVHMALGSLLQPTTHTVVLLSTLRSIGNFIDDSNFTSAEMTPEYVHNILLAIQRLLPQLNSPSNVKALSALVYAMITRGILDIGTGEMLIDVLLPAVYRLVNGAETTVNTNVNNNNNNNNNGAYEEEEEEEEFDAGAMGMLLDCLGACVTIAAPELNDRVWSLFPTVVVPCTISGGKLTIWVEDHAWELLLTMSRAAYVWNPFTRDALTWCLDNMKRDMSLLHIVVRCAYTLLLLCPEPMEYMSSGLMDHAVTVFIQTPSSELEAAYFALLGVIIKRGDTSLRCHFINSTLGHFLSSDSIQSELCSVHLAILLSWCVLPPFGDDTTLAVLGQVVSQHVNAASFAERIVLLVDISPSELATNQLVGLIQLMLQQLQPLLDAADVQMLQHVIVGVETRELEKQERLIKEKKHISGDGFNNNDNNNDNKYDDDGITRDPAEMLLELFGDESVSNRSPHMHRLLSLFGMNVK